MSRSSIDRAVADRIRRELKSRGLFQKDVAESAGMTQPQVSRMLSPYGPSIRADHLESVCRVLKLDPAQVISEAAHQASEFQSEPQERKGSDSDQVDALGRQLAEVMWNGADDYEFIMFAIDHIMDREDTRFWDSRKKQLVLMTALVELSYVIGRRYPVRDQFLLKRLMEPEEIVR